MRANLPSKDFFIGKTLPERVDISIIKHVASGNDGHLFRGHSSALRRDVACKIIPRTNLQHSEDGSEIWKAEVHKADALRNTAVVKFEDIRSWKDEVENIDCVVLISEFVEGKDLKKFISENSNEITVAFVEHWLETMLNLFHEMGLKEISHGDLHAGNVLVEDRSSYELVGPKYVFRVTDFGVAEATSEPRFKDDYLQLADILVQMLRVVNTKTYSPKEKYIFNILRHHFLSRHLVETDLTLDPIARRPVELVNRLRQLDTEFEREASQETTQLITPFDYLSCEQIGDAAVLLQALYSDRFLGLSEIESRNNIVVTGPRGCGKSMVFRSLSLDHKMRVGEATPERTHYIGVYYRCDDLYFAFPRYIAPARDEAIDIPIHFITATLLSKLLDLLEGWARQNFSSEFNRAEARVSELLWKVFAVDPPKVPGNNTFKTILNFLNKERLKATERQRFAHDPKRPVGNCFGVDILQKTCKVLSDTLPFLKQNPIYFFIDDYSSPKISKPLQESLNRIFMQRSSVCFFKISTESPVSFVKKDLDGKVYVENREFTLLNLGLIYLHADVDPKLSFIEDVFSRRLTKSATSFSAKNLEELVGSNAKQNNNEWARGVRNGEKPLIWGKEILCKLCSGDIHYLISLVGGMVRQLGGPSALEKIENSFKISPEMQNRAIREAAGSFLKNLRSIPSCGELLVNIVEAFGNVANSHLKFIDSKNEDGSPPKQASRIEPYEPFTLSEEAQKLYDELLRYSVFIEDFRGKSRRGSVVPRLFLRRFLIPHFNLTFSTRDSIEVEPSAFEAFLLQPKFFDQQNRLKSIDDAKRFEKKSMGGPEQLSLNLGGISQ